MEGIPMQTVLVTPEDIDFTLEVIAPYLDEQEDVLHLSEIPTSEELVRLGRAATVTVSGNTKAMATFVTTLSLYTRFPKIDDPRWMDMRGFGERNVELLQQTQQTGENEFRFTVKVTPSESVVNASAKASA
jgi:hypothetical protein